MLSSKDYVKLFALQREMKKHSFVRNIMLFQTVPRVTEDFSRQVDSLE